MVVPVNINRRLLASTEENAYSEPDSTVAMGQKQGMFNRAAYALAA